MLDGDRRRSPPRPERERRPGRRRAGRQRQRQPGVDRADCGVPRPSTRAVVDRVDALPRRPRGRRRGAGRPDRRPRGRGRHERPACRRPLARVRDPALPRDAGAARRRLRRAAGGRPHAGQTPGHVAYWHAEERVAITGDLLQVGDVAWVPFGGPWADGALERTIASLERIAALDPVRTIPGHGPLVTDVPAAVADNLERYARFREDPSRAVWHAVRRATVSHLMIAPRRPPRWRRCRGCRWRRPRSTSPRSSWSAGVGRPERTRRGRARRRCLRHHRRARRAHRFGTQSARFGVDP